MTSAVEKQFPWETAADTVRLETFREALEKSSGNVTRAAAALELSRVHAMRLLKKYGLVEFAAQLRLKAGVGSRVTDGPSKGRVLGRPQKG